MRDPLPPPPSSLSSLSQSLASALSLPTLPNHVHEVIVAVILYQFVQSVLSPTLSTHFFPNHYPKLNSRTRINWDVHVVSLVQSVIINALSLWVILFDSERASMNNVERIYGYTGAIGLAQAFGVGYFLWDLIVSTIHFRIFGPGLWAHALAACWVFSFGFRPFLNYYGPTFLLYELSSPFLNVHWFCDKLDLTGSPLQWYNGMALIGSFFGARLIWGNWQSVLCFRDIWNAVNLPVGGAAASSVTGTGTAAEIFSQRNGSLCLGKASCVAAQAEVMKYTSATTGPIPKWLALTYLSSNLVLNSLNIFWFGKMIATVKKRFEEPPSSPKQEKETFASVADGEAKKPGSGVDKGQLDGAPAKPRSKRADSVVLDVANGLEEDDFIGHPTSTAVEDAADEAAELRKRGL
ncbi:MAG: hypothetical protein Q9160_004088 [Pyrenula sp. 1 TL-2023]